MNIDDFDSYEAFLTRVNPIIESQAWAIAQACMYLLFPLMNRLPTYPKTANQHPAH